MIRALLIGLVTTIVLTVATPKEPTLKWKGGSTYLAINPLLSRVQLDISCGPDYEIVVMSLSPRTQEELILQEPSGGGAATCHLDRWQRLKD